MSNGLIRAGRVLALERVWMAASVMAALMPLVVLVAATSVARAEIFAVGCITDNDPQNCAVGEAQIGVAITDPNTSDGLILVRVTNSGPSASTVSAVHLHDPNSLMNGVDTIGGSAGVTFLEDASPKNLPGGDNVGFVTVFSVSNFNGLANGVDPDEFLDLTLQLSLGTSLGDVLASINDDTVRIGVHVQAIGSGGSESFVTADLCGDDVINPGEECDDGDRQDADGCSSSCQVEPGFQCSGEPSVCDGICGDGLIRGSEACDDGNQESGDGCDSGCQLEPGAVCQSEPSVCVFSCGNGTIDSGETCDDGNTQEGDCCSANCQFEPDTTVCRLAATVCDLEETCTGSSAACPADGFEPESTVCRASAGVCDPAESCTGSSAACPADAKSMAECRASSGICDVAEVCDGVNDDCSADGFEPESTVCRASAGVCDLAESCTGSSAACPADAKSIAECRASAGVCDVAEVCDGVSDDCPADAKSTAECRSAAGQCDLAEVCDGVSDDCPADGFEPASTVCRASAGVCDVEETCTGSSAGCPADGFEPDGTPCSDLDACTIDDQCLSGLCMGDPVICGDGMVTGSCGEECDDGNVESGDGCSSLCLVEHGFVCEGEPSECQALVCTPPEPHPGTPIVGQERGQQKCIDELNKGLAKVSKTQGKHIARCIKDGSRNRLGGQTIEECMVTDSRGKIARAKAKVVAKAARKCVTLPDFGPTDPNAANRAGVSKELGLIHDIFGSDLDAAVFASADDRAGSRCQLDVVKAVQKCQNAHFKAFRNCKKDGLKGKSGPDGADLPFDDPTDIELCLGFDAKRKIDRSCNSKLAQKIDDRCTSASVDLEAAFPGCTGEDLKTCLNARVECRVCLAVNETDGLALDCDLFDDSGQTNCSCF